MIRGAWGTLNAALSSIVLVRETDIRHLLQCLDDVRYIDICRNGDPDHVMSWVDINRSRVEINALAHRVNNTRWHGRPLNGHAPLFFQ